MTSAASDVDDLKRRRREVLPEVLADDVSAHPAPKGPVVPIYEPPSKRRPSVLSHVTIMTTTPRSAPTPPM
jgi:hypothetical protein